MAKKNKRDIAYGIFSISAKQGLPEPTHKPVEAVSRNQILDVYSNMEIKRDLKKESRYENVESVYSAFYAGLDPRRRSEMADGGMVKEDRNAMANLSPKPINQEYPRAGYYSNPYIDDSVEE